MNRPRANALPLPRRAPQFVSRRTAMALLDLSSSGFNSWIKNGVLPPPVAGPPLHEPRWSWAELIAWMHGDRSSASRDLLGVRRRLREGPNAAPRQARRTPAGRINGRQRRRSHEQRHANDPAG